MYHRSFPPGLYAPDLADAACIWRQDSKISVRTGPDAAAEDNEPSDDELQPFNESDEDHEDLEEEEEEDGEEQGGPGRTVSMSVLSLCKALFSVCKQEVANILLAAGFEPATQGCL